ncbi:MAG: polysaccharide pyruvyl transferase family protein [Acidimicrobiia bacterium]|nr:polysaccharide pyruvyl transferase family protein [Acidimicrobiia bacterium]
MVYGEVLGTPDEQVAAGYGDDRPDWPPTRWLVEGLEEGRERRCPVVWQDVGVTAELPPAEAERVRSVGRRRHAAVRDEWSRSLLEAAGLHDVATVPDSLLLLPRHLPADVLQRRLAYLRLMGWYPDGGETLVIEGGASMIGAVAMWATALSAWCSEGTGRSVVASTPRRHGRGRSFADALERASVGLPALHLFKLPSVTLEDLVAVFSAGAVLLCASPTGQLLGRAYGRAVAAVGSDVLRVPHVPDPPVPDGPVGLLAAVESARDAPPPDLSPARAAIDDRLDALRCARGRSRCLTGRGAPRARGRGGAADRPPGPGERLLAERLVFADRIQDLLTEQDRQRAEIAGLRAEVDALRAEAERAFHLESELQAVYDTFTFRATARLRALYGRMRRPR